ncbi:MAG TPA: methyltransferase domain-containing protein [Bacteroidetes bacterium]|nr:methyltransferase domain-containing protein [Bacteroidota bacterium]
MQARRPILLGTFLLSLIGYLYLHYFIVRGDLSGSPEIVQAIHPLGTFALLFGLAFAAYRLIDPEREYAWGITAGMIFRIALLFCLPNLSDDFYRFVWDGRMMSMGINPFDELPIDFMARIGQEAGQAWMDLYPHLNSEQYYSVYPPTLQAAFYLATSISGGDLLGSIIVLKLLVVIAEAGSLYFLQRIVARFGMNRKLVLIYALNPLVISELTGNLHFEAFMIVFLLGAFWMLMTKGSLPAALFLSLSIASKLLPVLIFPFLIRRMGWMRATLFGLLTGVFTLLLFALWLDWESLGHFRSSIELYFQKFEFNNGIYYFLRGLMGEKGYLVNRYLPLIVAGAIFYVAWKEKSKDWKGLAEMLLFSLTLYQLSAGVVHPWYIAPMVALSLLTPFRYPILWAFLIPFSYMAYYFPEFHQENWFLWSEYLLLLSYIAYEWAFKRSGLTLEEWMLKKPAVRKFIKKSIPARMAIKYERIAQHLNKEEQILDIGTGNGGLVHGLRADGFQVKTVDVKNISFFPDVEPIVYDGKRLPFPDNTFDTGIIITVLHHTPDPAAIIDEAHRVSRKKLVIMEDIYRNPLQKYLTYFVDSLVNLEFEGHPHTNKSDAGWKALFEEKGLKLIYREDFRTLVFFRQVIYVVEIN